MPLVVQAFWARFLGTRNGILQHARTTQGTTTSEKEDLQIVKKKNRVYHCKWHRQSWGRQGTKRVFLLWQKAGKLLDRLRRPDWFNEIEMEWNLLEVSKSQLWKGSDWKRVTEKRKSALSWRLKALSSLIDVSFCKSLPGRKPPVRNHLVRKPFWLDAASGFPFEHMPTANLQRRRHRQSLPRDSGVIGRGDGTRGPQDKSKENAVTNSDGIPFFERYLPLPTQCNALNTCVRVRELEKLNFWRRCSLLRCPQCEWFGDWLFFWWRVGHLSKVRTNQQTFSATLMPCLHVLISNAKLSQQ